MEDKNIDFAQRELTPEETERLENNFSYHAPFGNLPEIYGILRTETKMLAYLYSELAPQSRELSLALTKLEEAVMWVNSAIARNKKLE